MIAFKPILKKIVLVLLVIVALAGAASWALRAVGDYVVARLVPEIAHRHGIAGAWVGGVRPGLFATVAGPIRLGDPAAPFLEAAFLKLEYTPAGLIRRRIERISVNGVVITAAWRQGGLTLPGFSPPPSDESIQADTAAAFDWPLSIGAVEIENGLIRLDLDGDRLQLPLALTAVADDDMHRIDGRLRLFPRDQEIRISAGLDTTRRGLVLQLTAPALRPGSFADWTARILGLRWSGQVALSVRADLAVGPWQFVSADAALRLTDGQIAYQNLSLGPLDDDRPLNIQVSGTEDQGWRLNGSAALVSPARLLVSELDCWLAPAAEKGLRTGRFSMTLDRMPAAGPSSSFDLAAPVTVAGDMEAQYADGRWRVAVIGQNPPTGNLYLKNDDLVFKTALPAFTFSAGGAGEEVRFDAHVPLTRATLDTEAAGVVLSQALMTAGADIARSPDGGRKISGHVRLSAGKLSATPGPLTIGRAALDLPFAWPASGGDQGKLAIGPVTWRGLDLGSLDGTLQQEAGELILSGRYSAGSIPGLKGELNGRAGLTPDGPALAMDAHLRHQSEAADIDLGRFIPGAAGIRINADLDLRAGLGLRDGDFTGRLSAALAEGKIASAEKKMALTGIRANLTIPDLLTVRSAPAQKLFFKEASFGDIRAENGEIDFQLESATTLFVEKGGFQWCRGKVFAEGLRVSPDDDHYALTLYGDRLNLAEVLNQIGGIRAEGGGSVSGRIPIRFAAGDIVLDNGFLFSAPGEGGVIHLSKTDLLTAGLPPRSPQFNQIDLAREALKNYAYDWAKVYLNSEGDNLHVKLSFDGRPTRLLPFVYDKDGGGFVRSDESRKLSEFKGLSLDINFRIPLNELIGYKKALTF